MFTLWIEPEISQRGLNLERGDVEQAAVILEPNAPVQVLLNEDAELIARFVAARDIGHGETVTTADITEVTGVRPANLDPNAGWIAFARIAGQITLAFDFRYNRETAKGLLDRAAEYLDLVEVALERRNLGPAVENAFAAAELAVLAETHLLPTPPPRSHETRRDWLASWVEQGNAPEHSDEILSKLWDERGAARYGEGRLNMSGEEVDEAVAIVRGLIEHARERCRSGWD
jgi:HEPN domain-containing protein